MLRTNIEFSSLKGQLFKMVILSLKPVNVAPRNKKYLKAVVSSVEMEEKLWHRVIEKNEVRQAI